jgi:hypothetical protein
MTRFSSPVDHEYNKIAGPIGVMVAEIVRGTRR